MHDTVDREDLYEPWPPDVQIHAVAGGRREVECAADVLDTVCAGLVSRFSCCVAGLVVEEGPSYLQLRWIFYADYGTQIHVLVQLSPNVRRLPSISGTVFAADWHEREAEDLFGVEFEGHPHLGDFVLHNDRWPEGLCPMRPGFHDPQRGGDPRWQPYCLVHAPGAFGMPVGPIYGGVTESVHFLLETVGEDVIHTEPRLFYLYRAVEKLAEGRAVDDVLLLAERFAATTAVAHALAFCLAAEQISGLQVPPRARILRVLLAELERLRHHVGAIQGICESTALTVAANQFAIVEEELLRLSCVLTGHRYLFGQLACGGLYRDFDDAVCRAVVLATQDVLVRLQKLERLLDQSSSFLDRLEGVGIVPSSAAQSYGLVGPVARASGLAYDLRKAQPYGGYESFTFDVPQEVEGDGYARLRVLMAEARQSGLLMAQAVANLPPGPVRAPAVQLQSGTALGWVEAPRGAAFHWLRIDDDTRICRYHIMPPSFPNWHGFHLAAENFAFQDFPIILASFTLSAAENDR